LPPKSYIGERNKFVSELTETLSMGF